MKQEHVMVPQMVLINLPPGAPCLGPELGTPAEPLSYLLCSLEEGQAGEFPFLLRDSRGVQGTIRPGSLWTVSEAATFLLSLLSAGHWAQDLCPGLLVPWE